MLMFEIPFGTTDWDGVERTEHPGETGKAYWRTQTFNNIRVRMVEYTPGYLADHWCQKGHVWCWKVSCTPNWPTAAPWC
jgi:hypothetical protein